MQKIPLSVIVTAYNVEPYISACLEGIALQTLDLNRIELIIVDDGSTDGTLATVKAFAPVFPHFTLVSLPENTPGGTGIPSNIGMSKARGVYVGFVDGDDLVAPEMFETLLETAQDTLADLAMCSFDTRYERSRKVVPCYDLENWQQIFTPEFQRASRDEQKCLYLALAPVPWRKLYRREFLRRHAISFPVGNFFFEDNPFHWFNILRAERIACVDKVLITHRMQRAGQTMCGLSQWMNMADHVKTIRLFLLRNGYYSRFGGVFEGWVRHLAQTMSSVMPPDMLLEFREALQHSLSSAPESGGLAANA